MVETVVVDTLVLRRLMSGGGLRGRLIDTSAVNIYKKQTVNRLENDMSRCGEKNKTQLPVVEVSWGLAL